MGVKQKGQELLQEMSSIQASSLALIDRTKLLSSWTGQPSSTASEGRKARRKSSTADTERVRRWQTLGLEYASLLTQERSAEAVLMRVDAGNPRG